MGLPFHEQVGKGQLWLVGVLLGCPTVDFGTDVGSIDVIKGGDVLEDLVEFRQVSGAGEFAVVYELLHFYVGAL